MNILLFLLLIITSLSATGTSRYPETRQVDATDNYHGTVVSDPFRWLEEQHSPETVAWVEQQKKLTDDLLASCSARELITKRLTELWNYQKYSLPTKRKDYYFYWKNDGLQNQSILYRAKSLTDNPTVVLDPNAFSKDGTTSIGYLGMEPCIALSKDGTLLAYAISVQGGDSKEIRILNIQTGTEYPETLKQCKFTMLAWNPDNSGLYYNRFFEHQEGEDGVYWHTLGTDQTQDKRVYQTENPLNSVTYPIITKDGNYLLLNSCTACSRNGFLIRALNTSKPFTKIFNDSETRYFFVGNNGSLFYFITYYQADHGRLIAVDVEKNINDWKTIIPELDDTLSHATILNNQFICHFDKDARSSIRLYDLHGSFTKEVPLPGIGSAGFHLAQDELFIDFTSFYSPYTVFRYDFAHNTLTKIWDTRLAFDQSSYETKQIFYASKDGTTIPMFITYKKGTTLNGNNPTLLYGYGGFGWNSTPFFNPGTLVWLEQGGIFAVANIRGGSEYGKAWHESALAENRQYCFDDFIAAGKWLVNNNWTNPSKLAINGISNGGLLVGVCMQQCPELFGAVISQVPVTDMLRFPLFTAGRYWVGEYGDVNKPEVFKKLYAYSPLHNVQKNHYYPALMVTSADTDTRVVPLHAMKWVAQLQASSNGKNPILFRYETKAGHGAGKPTHMRIMELSDIYGFLFKIFNMHYQDIAS